jgi:hypothetical protein
MPRRGSLFNVARAALILVLSTSYSAKVEARPPSIALGEVTVKSAGGDAPTERRLRFLLGREIDRLRLDTSASHRGESYVLSASLVRLEARESRDGSRASCVVSATLRQARTGTLLVMMRGSGTAVDDRDMLEGAKERALEAAVYGAVRRLPEAL